MVALGTADEETDFGVAAPLGSERRQLLSCRREGGDASSDRKHASHKPSTHRLHDFPPGFLALGQEVSKTQ
jgi:hypothetical protein